MAPTGLARMREFLLRWAVLLVALPVCAGAALIGVLDPERLSRFAALVTGTAFRAVDWFYAGLVTGLLILAAWLALGRYGSVKLGLPHEQPEFSTASWLSMLFSAGMGIGLLFWGVAEPVLHFVSAPGPVPGSPAAARRAMELTVFHWGLHAWAVYSVAALVLAYFGFRRRTSYMPGAALRSGLAGRWVPMAAWLADLIAVIAVALGVAGSIAMGVFQLQRGLHVLAGVDAQAREVSLIILAVMVALYAAPLAMPLDKGIRWLSNGNMLLAVLVLLFLLFAGPTAFLLRSFVTTLGDYVSGLAALSFQLFPFGGEQASGWLRGWTLTYWIWWIAWAPFVGVFIARISRGRTIRQFVAGVLLVPAVFSVFWFSVFGGTGLWHELYGDGGVVEMVRHDVSIALFTLFDRLPGSMILAAAAVVLAAVFLITSIVSAAYVLGMLTGRGTLNPSARSKVAWGMALGALGAALVLSGNIDAVRAISVIGALPFSLVIVLQVIALLLALRQDSRPAVDPVAAGRPSGIDVGAGP